MSMQTARRSFLPSLGVALAILLGASGAIAASIQFEVEVRGFEPGFAFSFIHSGDSRCNADGFCMGGYRLFRLEGTLTGDLDAASGVLTLDDDIVLDAIATRDGAAAVTGLERLDRWSLSITGGQLVLLDFGNPLGDPGADHGAPDVVGGTIDYILSDDAAMPTVRDAGAFYFFPRDFSADNSPNTLTPEVMSLWGNNWDNLGDPAGQGLDPNGLGPLGIDIRAQGQLIPEPRAYALYAAGAGIVGLAIRRRRRGLSPPGGRS